MPLRSAAASCWMMIRLTERFNSRRSVMRRISIPGYSFPWQGKRSGFNPLTCFYETPNPDFVLYGDEAKYDTTFVFSSETDWKFRWTMKMQRFGMRAGKPLKRAVSAPAPYDLPLADQLHDRPDLVVPSGCADRALLHQLPAQAQGRHGLGRRRQPLGKRLYRRCAVTKTQTFDDQKNWVFDRIIPVEDVQSIIYDGVEIPLQRAE